MLEHEHILSERLMYKTSQKPCINKMNRKVIVIKRYKPLVIKVSLIHQRPLH